MLKSGYKPRAHIRDFTVFNKSLLSIKLCQIESLTNLANSRLWQLFRPKNYFGWAILPDRHFWAVANTSNNPFWCVYSIILQINVAECPFSNFPSIVPLILYLMRLIPWNKHRVARFKGISITGIQMIFYSKNCSIDKMVHISFCL